jgi:hypothetical protein
VRQVRPRYGVVGRTEERAPQLEAGSRSYGQSWAADPAAGDELVARIVRVGVRLDGRTSMLSRRGFVAGRVRRR